MRIWHAEWRKTLATIVMALAWIYLAVSAIFLYAAISSGARLYWFLFPLFLLGAVMLAMTSKDFRR